MPTTQQLLARYAAEGDAEAFATVAREHAGMVYATCRRVLMDATEAEDIAQECLLELARQAADVPEIVGGWLHRVATRKALNAARARKRRARHEGAAGRDRVAEASRDQPTWAELAPYVDDAIEQLPPELREALVLHFLEGRTQASLTPQLKVSQATVSRRLAQAVEVLRGILKKRGVLIGAATLTGLFTAQAVEAAAPAAVLAGLGKIAASGVGATPAAGGGSAAGATVKTAVLAGGAKKAVVTLAVALAVVVGGVAVSRQLKKDPPPQPAQKSAPRIVVDVEPVPPEPVAQKATAEVPREGKFGPLPEERWALAIKLAHPDGRPYAKDEVSLQWEETPPGGSSRTRRGTFRTDAEGVFRLQAARRTRYRFLVLCGGAGYALHGPSYPQYGDDLEPLALTLKPMGHLAGQVLEKKTKTPVAGAQVFCSPRMPAFRGFSLLRVPETDGQGRFTLRNIPPGQWSVTAKFEGFIALRRKITIEAAKEPTEFQFALEPTIRLVGLVLGEDGKTPVAGARVRRHDTDRGIETDEQGRFTFENVKPRHWRIWVEADGYARHERSIKMEAAGREEPVTIILRYRGGSVRGAVIDADRRVPLGGVVVAAAPTPTHWFNYPFYLRDFVKEENDDDRRGAYAWTRTDKDGRYTLSHIPQGRQELLLIHERGLSPLRKEVEIKEGKTSEGVDFEVRELPKGYVVFRFVDAAARPLGKKQVRMDIRRTYRNGSSRGSRSFQSREDGIYYFPVERDGQHKIAISSPGCAVVKRELDLRQDQSYALQQMVLGPGDAPVGADAVSGRLFLGDGKTPAVGVMVIPVATRHPLPKTAESQEKDVFTEWLEDKAVKTDEQGRFLIPDLRAGAYKICGSPFVRLHHGQSLRPDLARYLPALSEAVDIRDGRTTKNVEVTLQTGGSVVGTVRDGDTDKPLDKVHVSLTNRGSRRPLMVPLRFRQFRAESNAQGAYRIDGIPPRTYSLAATDSGHGGYDAFHRREVVVTPGAETTVDCSLPRVHFGKVAGRVLLPDGQPARGAGIHWNRVQATPMARTDREGKFLLENVRVGSPVLAIEYAGLPPFRSGRISVTRGKTTQVELRLTAAGVIKGRALLGEGKTPAANVTVGLWERRRSLSYWRADRRQNTLEGRRTQTDDKGGYEFENVPGVPFTLFLFHDGLVRDARENVTVAAGKTLSLDLKADNTFAVVEGTVTTHEGTLVKAMIWLFGRLTQPGADRVMTDEQGRFKVENLLPGTYLPTAMTQEHGYRFRKAVTLARGQTATVDFVLKPPGAIEGRVTRGANGKPMSDAKVTTLPNEQALLDRPDAIPDNAGYGEVRAGDDGRFTLKHLAPGTYTLYVRIRGPEPACQVPGIVVRSGETTEGVELRVP